MKTDICVECSAKITKKKRNYKSQNLPIFCVSATWFGLARFGRIIRIIRVKTLTFRIRSFFIDCSTFGSLGFFCYLYVKLPRSASPHQEAAKEKSEVSDVKRA